jgi:hypothetical protein
MNLREASDLVTELSLHDYDKGIFKTLEESVFTNCSDFTATNPNTNWDYLLKLVWIRVKRVLN